ncbi:hypothetical protein CRYUN_Cryun23aG0099700 [Craigia yunnanensis]
MARPPIISKWTETNGWMKMKRIVVSLGDIDLGGMDFSNFGDMGGMGGGGMDDFEDSDDEEQEVTKPAEQDTNNAEGDAKPKEQGAGTSEKKEAAPST